MRFLGFWNTGRCGGAAPDAVLGSGAGASAQVGAMALAPVRALAVAALAALLTCVLAGAAYAAPQLEEYQGSTRYETAAAQAAAAFPEGVSSGYAVLVSGENDGWPDALSASSLAGMLDCPVLLTSTWELPQTTCDVLDELNIDHVVVVGGEAAVSADVAAEVEGLVSAVERVSGSNRQDTQSAVYRYGKEHGVWSSQAFVASCGNFADALSASSIAYSNTMPVFLVWPDGSFTDSQVADLFDGSIESAIVLGGQSAVSDATEGFMQVATMINSQSEGNSGNVERISGGDRYETSLAIAEWAAGAGCAGWNNAAFASGSVAADALAGSSLQGKDDSVVLLVDNAGSATVSGIAYHAHEVSSSVRVFGGTSAVSVGVREAICNAVGAPYLFSSDEDCSIMGSPLVSVRQMVAMYNSMGKAYPSEELGAGGAWSIWDFCSILYDEAVAEDVRPEVVFAQSMHETGWLQFGGDVSVEQFNFAGLGATGGGEPGNYFADVRTGLRAQVQHLKAYASTDSLNQACVDSRFNYVTRGCAPTVQSLGGKWAVPGTYYGSALMKIINMTKTY